MMVRNCAGTPLRNSNPGSSVAPKPRVMPRFTSATATSMAGIAPSTQSRPSHHGREALGVQDQQRYREQDRGQHATPAAT